MIINIRNITTAFSEETVYDCVELSEVKEMAPPLKAEMSLINVQWEKEAEEERGVGMR